MNAPTHVATTPRTIGAILVDSGKLDPAAAERVLRLQKEKGLRFGDAALQLKLLRQEDIDYAIASQYNYPYLLKSEGKADDELIAAYQPFSPEVENLRALRSQLMLRWFTGEPDRKMLAIVSAGPAEGRSYLAANLAVIFSQLGERTLLIDADMRQPRQHTLFGAENRSGLSAILSGRGGDDVIRQVPEFLSLDLLTAGPQPPNPQELFGRPACADLLNSILPKYDVILFDTPAAAVADAQMIAARAGAALIVARKHTGSLAATRELVERLGQVGVNIVGAVVTEFRAAGRPAIKA